MDAAQLAALVALWVRTGALRARLDRHDQATGMWWTQLDDYERKRL